MNPKVVERLFAGGRGARIPYQLAASGRATPTDANAIQVNRAGVAAALVSIPNRYMHSPVEIDLAGRHGPRGRPAGPVRRKPAGRRGIDAVGRGQFWVETGRGTDRK